jgi:hypothetical protein
MGHRDPGFALLLVGFPNSRGKVNQEGRTVKSVVITRFALLRTLLVELRGRGVRGC